MEFYAHPTACVDDGAVVGKGTKIWHFGHIMGGANIGKDCILGQNCYIAENVIIGSNVKIQNNVSVYQGTLIEDDVFLGPSCVLTNVSNPRSEIDRKKVYEKTLIKKGATIGANATIICGVTLGRYSFVAAGAVVTKSIPDYGHVQGVPGRLIGFVSRHCLPLEFDKKSAIAICPESNLRYSLEGTGIVRCLDLAENDPLPEEYAHSTNNYRWYREQSTCPDIESRDES